jgi:outer membrane protein OmpA-like peptidoglycan-associated protein
MLRKIAVMGALLWSSIAGADDGTVDFEMFRPFPDAYGYLSMPSAATLGHLQVGGAFWANYSNDPVVLVYDGNRVAPNPDSVSGDKGDALVDDRYAGNLHMGVGVSRFFSLTLDLPMVMLQSGYQTANIDNPSIEPQALISAGIGDLRIQPKLVALDRDRVPVGLSIAVPVGLPTGNGGSFLGEGAATVTPSLVLEFSDASIRSRSYIFRTALMGGYRVRSEDRMRDVRLDDEIVYGIAMALHPVPPLEIIAEFHGSVWGPQLSQAPAEFLAGLKFMAGRYVNINLGGGAGVLPGIGSPDYRIVAGVSVAPSFDPNARDSDKDGIVDGMDRCVKDAEDLDNFQDADGCPELDNDADAIPDLQDQCPDDPEDDDGWLDNDGCPDADNDKDGILDVADRCPSNAETVNGYQDEDGCPDDKPVDDTDGDGYKDDVDRCPYDAEDFDNYEDEDGCPDNDNDTDGILDVDDACPVDREVYNGVEDEDGCPDEGRVIVESSRIKITEKIYFDFNKATIQTRSFSLLDEIAATIKAHPTLLKIRVEGHTDDVGGDSFNRTLSEERAQSVMNYLVASGVEVERMDARGFGEDYPIESNDTDSGRASNRRVEFIIVDQE